MLKGCRNLFLKKWAAGPGRTTKNSSPEVRRAVCVLGLPAGIRAQVPRYAFFTSSLTSSSLPGPDMVMRPVSST